MSNNPNTITVTASNEFFDVSITSKHLTDTVEDFATVFRGVLLALTFHPNTVDAWVRDPYNTEAIDEANNEANEDIDDENPCMMREEDDCDGCEYKY